MLAKIIKAAIVFIIFFFLKPAIDNWALFWRFLGYVAGIGYPISLICDPGIDWLDKRPWIRNIVAITIKTAVIFVVFFFLKPTIDNWSLFWRFFGYVAGVGYPISVICGPGVDWLNERKRKLDTSKQIRDQLREALRASLNRWAQMPKEENPSKEPPPQSEPVVLDQAQLNELNSLRSCITVKQVERFPRINFNVPHLKNYVTGAGVFTDTLRQYPPLSGNDSSCMPDRLKVVGLFASVEMIKPFEKANSSKDRSCRAEGYVLPSRTGLSYSVFYVTRILVGDKLIDNAGGI